MVFNEEDLLRKYIDISKIMDDAKLLYQQSRDYILIIDSIFSKTYIDNNASRMVSDDQTILMRFQKNIDSKTKETVSDQRVDEILNAISEPMSQFIAKSKTVSKN